MLMTCPITPQRMLQIERYVRWSDYFDCNLALAQIRNKFSADCSALLRRLLRIFFKIKTFLQL
jgi:hypothetical protein